MQQSGAPKHHQIPGDAAMQRGERFKRVVQSKANTLGYHTDEALAEAAGINANTLRNGGPAPGRARGTRAAGAGVPDPPRSVRLNAGAGREPPRPEPSVAVAIKALAVELHALRTRDRNRLAVLERTVELLAGSLLPGPATGGSQAPRAPRTTGE